jgi:exosome complex RNA-binding protein Rrp42 (RNase PH superfamily)
MSGMELDAREDGRSRLQRRPLTVRTGVKQYAAGSAQVDLAGTAVVVGVTCDVAECASEDAGQLQFSVDCTSAAVSAYNSSMQASARTNYISQLTHTLTSLYGVPMMPEADPAVQAFGDEPEQFPTLKRAFDATQLFIGDGHAFVLQVDVSVVAAGGGNVATAMTAAVKAALQTTVLPTATINTTADGTVAINVDAQRAWKAVEATNAPLLVAMQLGHGLYVVDPSLQEELTLQTSVLLGVTGDGAVAFSQHAPQFGNGMSVGGLAPTDLKATIREGANAGCEYHAALAQSLSLLE